MPDREKVIKGLECLITNEVPCDGCPYNEGKNSSCLKNIAKDALELLKEQKPKAVKIKKNAYNHEFYYCPRCDREFENFFREPMFCDKCGQAVKWDD